MTAPAPDIAGLVAEIRSRVATGELDLRHVGELLTGKWDQDAPAALLQAATTLQSEHSARLAAEGRAEKMREALVAAKREMWMGARAQWTLVDFKNWAVIQQIDEALGNPALGEKGG